MNTVITLLHQHDLRQVAVAAFICALASFAGVSLLDHAKRSSGGAQKLWLAIAAVSVGFGVWSTHFVAMLSFSPGVLFGYDFRLTTLSLVIAMVFAGAGFWYAAIGRRRSDDALGGAIAGLGISAMHYIGISGLQMGGAIEWTPPVIGASLLIGIVLGATSLLVSGHSRKLKWRIGGAVTLTLAICGMHFTGMGAADFSRCFTSIAPSDMTPENLTLGIAGASIVILLAALGGLYLDVRDRRRTELEADRMRGLADAAIEGLLVCDRDLIVTANQSFAQLAGASIDTLTGRRIVDFLTPVACTALFEHPNLPVETEMATDRGDHLPVETILREVEFGGKKQYAIAVRDLSARKQAEQHIRFLAHHDALTGLPNRASFNEELAISMKHARRQNERVAVFCLDLDRFKEVNDLFGHAAGDALLQRVAAALIRLTGKGQFAARLGGDEFAVIADNIESAAHAGRVAEAILDAFRRENDAAADGIVISTSIGIAMFPENAEDSEHLMNYADTALYRAKRDGRGIYRFFETEMGVAVRDRRLLEHDLRHAISRNQMALVFQPQVNIQSGEITGFEALLRWEHPERGSVSPAEFIPIAEESGLILNIGEWVMRMACAEACRWARPLSIAINVSTVQLHNPHFAQIVTEVLVKTGLSPSRLEIEITESALIQDIGRALIALRQVKALGVRIAMDDFGTGYSSLANLRAFPFDKIKVDQSFIKSVDNNDQSAAIVRAVLGLGNGLNLPVVAEGVERQEELDFLKGEICAEAQGFFLGRPQSIEAFEALTSGRENTIQPVSEVATPLRATA